MRPLLFSILFISYFCHALQAQQNDSIVSKGLGEIEVTAISKPSTSQSSTPLQILSGKDIQKQGIQSLTDAMKRFNGVVLKDYGGIGGLKTVSIRGMGAEYTAISYDGVMINNLQSGQVDIGRFTLENISMLSLNIGQADDIFQTAKSFSSAGTLNLKTASPLATDNKHKISTKLTTGSWGYFEPALKYSYKASERFAVTANANWQRADGMYSYTVKQDTKEKRARKNSDTDIFRTEVNLYSKPTTNDYLDIKFYYYDSERGLPKSVAHTIDDREKERLWDKNAFTQIAYKNDINKRLKFKSQAKYDYNYSKHRGSVTDIKSISRYKQHEVYWSNSALYSILPPLSISLAQDVVYNSLRAEYGRNGDRQPQPNRYSSFTALAAQYRTDRVSITASGLGTYVREKVNNGYNDSKYKKLSPSISASVKPFSNSNIRLRASYKHIYRIPTFNELYYVASGKVLNAESSKQYNGGITWVGSIIKSPFQYINLSADVYYNDINDKIVIAPGLFQPRSYNVGKVEMKGIDLKASTNIKIKQEVSLDLVASYSYIRAYDTEKRDEDGNVNPAYEKQLIYTPKNSGSTSLTINNPWVNITYSILFSDIRFSGKENLKTQEIESYTDQSIAFFRELDIKKHTLYVIGNLDNLANKNYSVINGFPMPGRSFKITLGCNF